MTQTIDFAQLIRSSECGGLTLDFKSKLVDHIREEFTDEEQKWFIANFYVYLQYHPTNDFPIKLENVWDMIGFSTKANAKRTLKNNFTEGDDYKIIFIPTDEKSVGRPEEEILLNIDTFKNLCMITKTEKSKKIRKYYIKLEGLFNTLVKEQREEFEQKLKLLEEENNILLQEKNALESLPDREGFAREAGELYGIIDRSRDGYHMKFGIAANSLVRVDQLNVGSSTNSLDLYVKFKTFDRVLAEKLVHSALQPFRIKKRKEWFYFQNNQELAYAISTIKEILEFITRFNIKNFKEFKEITKNINPQDHLIPPEESERLNKENQEKIIEMTKKKNREVLQKAPARKGLFKGVSWDDTAKLWCAQLQNNYKNAWLGKYSDEIDAAKVYNDYAMYLNETEGTSFLLNDIPGYRTVPRNIPDLLKREKESKKSSRYRGVSYDSKRKFFVASVQLSGKVYNLGWSLDEVECAKRYNQQALYFNNTLNTNLQLNEIDDYITEPKDLHSEIRNSFQRRKTSKYIGVSITRVGKWACSYMMNRKKVHIGTFNTELEAAKAYNERVSSLNASGFNYKVNDLAIAKSD
jgi:phage anti-repressor protein